MAAGKRRNGRPPSTANRTFVSSTFSLQPCMSNARNFFGNIITHVRATTSRPSGDTAAEISFPKWQLFLIVGASTSRPVNIGLSPNAIARGILYATEEPRGGCR